jgi:beta-D-xylosidase 4
LKNEGGLLPLSPTKEKVAVLGPHFNSTVEFQSIYFGENKHVLHQSPLEAIKRRGVEVVGAARGCDYVWCNTSSGFAEAVALAKSADVAIVFIGLWLQENEGWDRIELRAPGMQENLVQAIMAVNPRTVVVMINGGGLAVEWTYSNVPAVVEGFYPGQAGGDALTAVLFGDAAPTGRLPMTIYPNAYIWKRQIGDMWLHESDPDCVSNCKQSGPNAVVPTYRYLHGDSLPCPPPNEGKDCGNSLAPLYRMGHGLSYTTWTLKHSGAAHVSATTVKIADEFEPYFKNRQDLTTPAVWKIEVTNTGTVPSGLVVLCFVSSEHTDAPRQKLVGFERVPILAAGASTTVQLFAATTALTLTDKVGTEAIHAGSYVLTCSAGDDAKIPPLAATLSLTGSNVTLWSLKAVREKHEAEQRALELSRSMLDVEVAGGSNVAI